MLRAPEVSQLGKEFRGELLGRFLERRHVDEVVALVRVGLQVVEPVAIPHAVVVDVFEALGADGEGGGLGGEIPFPVISYSTLMTQAFATLQQRHEGTAVHGGGVGRALRGGARTGAMSMFCTIWSTRDPAGRWPSTQASRGMRMEVSKASRLS